MKKEIGYCLPSQDLREYIKQRRIDVDYNEETEKRIQTNSYEPTIGTCCYWLDDEIATFLRSNTTQPIEEALKEIPRHKKKKFDISQGFILNVGHSYLFPLNERIKLEDDEYVKISPKSSIGRTFLDVRAFAEKNPCSDIVHPRYSGKEYVKLWLLVHPQKFNVVVKPGLSMNQLRIFKGVGARLSRKELVEEFEKRPFLKNREGKPYDAFITEDGVVVHVCLTSRNQRKKLKNLKVERGDCILLFTDEIFDLPAHINAEMRAYSLTNIRGPLHFAGFFDNGFRGDGVIELMSEEKGSFLLSNKSPIAEFDFYRTRVIPDKIYGDEKSGSNYAGQHGPRMPKYFKPIATNDLIALRAKKTPLAIDLSKKHFYEVDEFFEII
ncbi:MAG: 2'-deoxycytidine 5'-triphosphate deaminase domain-containing protein [Candidatus Woesearchaeota archaeon]